MMNFNTFSLNITLHCIECQAWPSASVLVQGFMMKVLHYGAASAIILNCFYKRQIILDKQQLSSTAQVYSGITDELFQFKIPIKGRRRSNTFKRYQKIVVVI